VKHTNVKTHSYNSFNNAKVCICEENTKENGVISFFALQNLDILRERSNFAEGKFLLQSLERTFQTLVCTFQSLGLTFQSLKWKNPLRIKRFTK
jgi:hypothetical protein